MALIYSHFRYVPDFLKTKKVKNIGVTTDSFTPAPILFGCLKDVLLGMKTAGQEWAHTKTGKAKLQQVPYILRSEIQKGNIGNKCYKAIKLRVGRPATFTMGLLNALSEVTVGSHLLFF